MFLTREEDMQKLICVLIVAAGLFVFSPAQAALVNYGGGFIYDTDLNITWYQNVNNTGLLWANANAWATSLNVGGVTGWRLPTTPAAQVNTYTTEGEYGHLFITELGNSLHNSGLTNTGPFINMGTAASYWTGTDAPGYGGAAAVVYRYDGYEGAGYKGSYWLYSMAVHDGNVAPVPLPAAVWLFGAGLLGLVGIRRKFKS